MCTAVFSKFFSEAEPFAAMFIAHGSLFGGLLRPEGMWWKGSLRGGGAVSPLPTT